MCLSLSLVCGVCVYIYNYMYNTHMYIYSTHTYVCKSERALLIFFLQPFIRWSFIKPHHVTLQEPHWTGLTHRLGILNRHVLPWELILKNTHTHKLAVKERKKKNSSETFAWHKHSGQTLATQYFTVNYQVELPFEWTWWLSAQGTDTVNLQFILLNIQPGWIKQWKEQPLE